MNYCPSDMFVLEEFIFQGEMLYVCKNCGFQRELMPHETLLFERQLESTSGVFNAQDIARDRINHRVPINCKCGSKVAVISVNGPECNVIAVCVHCHVNVEL